ncbi:sensor histidine kinase [Helicobacter suis]|uniref:sensor histidine kinase n=1 Tax=Helicobacter suis TaxID=104628 RepID=UPI0024931ECB|nr:HAMP domain-containing sensor histidine kinase [Helicobacter suis]
MKFNMYEKQSLRRFFALLLGFSFVLITLIALLFLHNAKSLILENTQVRLQAQSNEITQDIIEAHMHHWDEPFKTLARRYSYLHFVLLDGERHVLYNHNFGNATSLAFFGHATSFPLFLDQKDAFYLVDNKTFGHLGVDLVLIEENHPHHLFASLYRRVLLIFSGVFICMGAMSFFLARLFLKPLADERSRISAFSQDLAHELNTPIAALLIAAKALFKQENNPKLLGILASAQRISHLYYRLAYISTQDLNLDTQLLDLKTLVAQQIASLDQMATFYQLELKSHLEPKTFEACEEDMVTLVSNLLMNAIKYNHPQGFIQVVLNQDLSVCNSGQAIPTAKIEALRKRYSCLDVHKKGYGIGLDLVHKICERYDLRLEISSEPIPSSRYYQNTFKVCFPPSLAQTKPLNA